MLVKKETACEKNQKNVYGISGHFVMDCRRKETAQCSKTGEKEKGDSACRRQRDGRKYESVAMGLSLSTPNEEYWAAVAQRKTAGMLVVVKIT